MLNTKTLQTTTLIEGIDVPETTYYIEKSIKHVLQRAKSRVIKRNQDRVYLITGREGSGKSTLAQHLAYFVDNTFKIEDIVFTSDDFEKRIREVDRFKAVVFDEAFNGLSSKSALSRENKRLVKLLMECRARNLFVFIVCPTFLLLEWYIASFRSHALFHVWEDPKLEHKRSYKVLNYKQKKWCYDKDMEEENYMSPRYFEFYYQQIPSITLQEYKDKKDKAFKDVPDKKEHGLIERWKKQRNFLIYLLCEEKNMKKRELSERFLHRDMQLNQDEIGVICCDERAKASPI